MPRERDPPYVSAGFREDAGKIINQFLEKRTLFFHEFAELWREMKFSLIFMGRENLRELVEFIEECYRNTLLFMNSSNPYQKVAALYLLYSLYYKQPPLLKTCVVIKISIEQLFELYEVERHFVESEIPGCDNLSYILTVLCKDEAFHISSCPIPMGPIVPIPLLRLEPLRNSKFKEALGTFSMVNDKEIKYTVELTESSEELKRSLPFVCGKVKTTTNLSRFGELKEYFQQLEERYNAGLLPSVACGHIKIEDEFKRLGRRRAMLKTQQFERATDVGMSRRVRASSDSSTSPPPSPSRTPTPPLPVKRGRGRPRKISKRGRKRKDDIAEVHIKIEPELPSERENGLDAEIVDDSVGPSASYPPPRRPSTKLPRAIRRHYFEEGSDQNC